MLGCEPVRVSDGKAPEALLGRGRCASTWPDRNVDHRKLSLADGHGGSRVKSMMLSGGVAASIGGG